MQHRPGAGALRRHTLGDGNDRPDDDSSITGTYDGKLSADGAEMGGTYAAQGAPGLPLTLKPATADTAWAIPAAPAPPRPMAADANLSFEVATIKPSKPDAQGIGILYRRRQLTTLNTTLVDLLAFAYGLHARQIVGTAT